MHKGEIQRAGLEGLTSHVAWPKAAVTHHRPPRAPVCSPLLSLPVALSSRSQSTHSADEETDAQRIKDQVRPLPRPLHESPAAGWLPPSSAELKVRFTSQGQSTALRTLSPDGEPEELLLPPPLLHRRPAGKLGEPHTHVWGPAPSSASSLQPGPGALGLLRDTRPQTHMVQPSRHRTVGAPPASQTTWPSLELVHYSKTIIYPSDAQGTQRAYFRPRIPISSLPPSPQAGSERLAMPL